MGDYPTLQIVDGSDVLFSLTTSEPRPSVAQLTEMFTLAANDIKNHPQFYGQAGSLRVKLVYKNKGETNG